MSSLKLCRPLPPCSKLPLVRFHVMSRAAAHGLKSPARFLHRAIEEFACEHLLGNIGCPVWSTDNEGVDKVRTGERRGAFEAYVGGGLHLNMLHVPSYP